MKSSYLPSIRNVSFLLLVLSLLGSCTLSRMIKMSERQHIQMVPNPLELHGGRLSYDVVADLPPKILPKGKVYTLNFVYKTETDSRNIGSIELETVRRSRRALARQAKLQGQKASALRAHGEATTLSEPTNERPSIRVTKRFDFNYEEAFARGVIEVQSVASNPANQAFKTSGWKEWGKGTLLTAQLIQPILGVSYAAHGYVEGEELLPHDINFFFERGSSRLRRSEIESDRAAIFNAFLSDQNELRRVNIVGLHSPEGLERINKNLSEERATRIEDWYRKQMKRYDYQNVTDSVIFDRSGLALDWEPLREHLRENTGLSEGDKNTWLDIINGRGSYEDKEKKLQELPTYRRIFDRIYPQLRTAKTHLLVVKKKHTREEIAAMSKEAGQVVLARAAGEDVQQQQGDEASVGASETAVSASSVPATEASASDAMTSQGNASQNAPSAPEWDETSLTQEELLFGATLTPVLVEKEGIYQAAIHNKDTWVAHNNLGCVYLEQARERPEGGERQARIDKAVVQFELAFKLQSEIAEVSTNLAIAYLLQGSDAQAYDHLLKALAQNPDAILKGRINAAKGALESKMGKYDAAIASLQAAEESAVVFFNWGLAHLLKKEYTKAQRILSRALALEQNHAYSHYVMAVLGARTKQKELVKAHLEKAIAARPDLKERAILDLEFEAYPDLIRRL